MLDAFSFPDYRLRHAIGPAVPSCPTHTRLSIIEIITEQDKHHAPKLVVGQVRMYDV